MSDSTSNGGSNGGLNGPLAGLKVVEFAGLGPAPFAGMMLADMGADVIVIDRPGVDARHPAPEHRGKRSVLLDLKSDAGLDAARRLVLRSNALIEGFRPGVMERLGLGPEPMLAANPKLVYGRVTGWGQSGPLSQAAGHDINYVSLTGAMSIAARPGEAPMIPATLLGDMAGGAMFLLFGILCALREADRSGQGQVVDAAMVDGVAALASLVHQRRGLGTWSDTPAENFFLGSSPFYDTFVCADGRYISLGAIEPQFYALLLQKLGLHDVQASRQYSAEDWPALRTRVAAMIASQPQAHWCALLEGTDVCFAPVLSLAEAAHHPHLRARHTFVEVNGQLQPSPAPRLSRSSARRPGVGPCPGEHTAQVLAELGR
jgi:alpha-methylacyl-CoA racemase